MESLLKHFDFHYSYDNQNYPVNEDYFKIDEDGVLRIKLYERDSSYNTNLENICSEIQYKEKVKSGVVSFDYKIKEASGGDFSLFQIAENNEPIIMYRCVDNKYQLFCNALSCDNICENEDKDGWVSIEINFTLDYIDSAVRMYRNGVLKVERRGNIFHGDDCYVKIGVSSQMKRDMEVMFRNIAISI